MERHLRNAPTDRRELTVRGTKIAGGRIWEDQNPDMRCNVEAQNIYSEMERTDGVISGALMLVDETLRSARLDIEPADDSQIAGRMAEYVKWALNVDRKRRPRGTLLASMLRPFQTFASRGFAYGEIVPTAVTPHTGPYKGRQRIVVDRIAFCEQSAHGEWVLDDEGRHLSGITQRPWGDASRWHHAHSRDDSQYGRPVVPIERLLRLSFQGYGHNYAGIALLRRALFPWRAKNSALDSGVVAIERFGSPTPTVEFDRRAAMDRGYSGPEFDSAVDQALGNLEAYVVDKQGFLASTPGITYDTFGAGAIDSQHVVEFVKMCNREILLGLLAQFFTLGIGDVGSRSVGMIHRSVHARFVANLMSQIVQAVTEQVIYPICCWEFGVAQSNDYAPRLRHHDIDSAKLGEALGVLPGLFQAGVLKHSQAFENEVLRVLAGAESAGDLITASEAVPEGRRGIAPAFGVFKPGPGRPKGEG